MAALPVTFAVENYGRAVAFYTAILEPLGLAPLWRDETSAGFGVAGRGDAALVVKPGSAGARSAMLAAPNRAAVDAAHFVARAMGGSANLAPGSMHDYGKNAYGASLFDPEGLRLDVVLDGTLERTVMTTATSAPARVSTERPLLEIKGLKTHFKTDDGMVRAVDGVDISIMKGETVGVVGESGCGKTVTAMSILKLIAMPPGQIVEGQILYNGRDLVPLTTRELDEIRSKEIAIVFQEPMTSLNPVYTVGDQIAEVLRRHEGMNNKQALDRTAELLSLVQIPNPSRRLHDYPHQFSGGMRQRVMIAMALACNPKLLIADEPTTALDVTIQAQILDLMAELKDRFGMAIMLITHAMGVVAEVTQRVVVMYAGRVVEEASVEQLFANPRHPYTQGLIRSIPRIDLAATQKVRLEAIKGTVPSLLKPPPGCRFAPRCKFATAKCIEALPLLKEIEPGHKVACIL
jgi:peptide/nickel transport system ATP-binding protein